MTSVSTADTWREAGPRAPRRLAARPEGADYVSRIGRPPVPPPPPRPRATELPPFPENMARTGRGDDAARSGRGRDGRPVPPPARPPADRPDRSPRDTGRGPSARDGDRARMREDRSRELRGSAEFAEQDDRLREPRPSRPRTTGRRPGATARAPETGSRLRGAVAVLAVFLVTLAGAGLETWIGNGPGLMTLVLLTAASSVATFVVRRSDLLTPVIAPPLVYVGVALLVIALSPATALNLTAMAPLLVRGFPAMAVATAAAAVVALIRWAARR